MAIEVADGAVVNKFTVEDEITVTATITEVPAASRMTTFATPTAAPVIVIDVELGIATVATLLLLLVTE
jgi:hypothetical protein